MPEGAKGFEQAQDTIGTGVGVSGGGCPSHYVLYWFGWDMDPQKLSTLSPSSMLFYIALLGR